MGSLMRIISVGFRKTPVVQSPEFNVTGATYYAVAPAGYSFSADQTTNYGTRTYNTLSDACSAFPSTATTPIIVNILGDWTGITDTAEVLLTTITSSVNNITLRTIGAARHNGKWNLSSYRLQTDGSNPTINIQTDYLTVTGLQILGPTNQYIMYSGAKTVGSNHLTVSYCIMKKRYSDGIGINSSEVVANIFNCVMIGDGSTYGPNIKSLGILTISNCTLGNNGGSYALRNLGQATVTNCLFIGISSFSVYDDVQVTEDYNSTDGSYIGFYGPNTNDRISQTFTFVDSANDDYHLDPTDTGALGWGTDLNGYFTDDIDGQTRTDPWDIGADQH